MNPGTAAGAYGNLRGTCARAVAGRMVVRGDVVCVDCGGCALAEDPPDSPLLSLTISAAACTEGLVLAGAVAVATVIGGATVTDATRRVAPLGLRGAADAGRFAGDAKARDDAFRVGDGRADGGPQTSGSSPSRASPKSPNTRAMTSFEGVGGSPFSVASSVACLTKISCSHGISRPPPAPTNRDSSSARGGVLGSRFSFVRNRFAPAGTVGSPHCALRRPPGDAFPSGAAPPAERPS